MAASDPLTQATDYPLYVVTAGAGSAVERVFGRIRHTSKLAAGAIHRVPFEGESHLFHC